MRRAYEFSVARRACRGHRERHDAGERTATGVSIMLNRSAVVIGHEPAFYGWLKTTGVDDATIVARRDHSDRSVYLIPACHHPEELEEVVEDLFEAIFRHELAAWQPDEKCWPDTTDFALFTRFFTVEGFSYVADVGRGPIGEENAAT